MHSRNPNLPRFRYLTLESRERLLDRLESESDQGWRPVSVTEQRDGRLGVLLEDVWETDTTELE